VAAALARAAVSERAAGRVYNVAERPAFSQLEWTRRIGDAAGWGGEIVVLPKERMPEHLRQPGNSVQHWETDSTRIREELGYEEPVSVDEGIRRTIDWIRSHPPEEFNPRDFDYAAEDAALKA